MPRSDDDAADPLRWPCCKHCLDDGPSGGLSDHLNNPVLTDNHDTPCNAPDPCPMEPVK